MKPQIKIIDPERIINSLKNFDGGYHEDFINVFALSDEWLKSNRPPSDNLCEKMVEVLRNWGAGRRSSPRCVKPDVLCEYLNKNKNIIKDVKLATVEAFKLKDPDPNALYHPKKQIFDFLLILSKHCLSENNRITYPTKLLMLIAGLGPAFDSQVCSGLHKIGVSGFGATSFVMPDDDMHVNFRKIYGTYILLAQLWWREKNIIVSCVNESDKDILLKGKYFSPGRIFDILLFQDGSGLKADNCDSGWYDRLQS